jgi:hypothetical protein
VGYSVSSYKPKTAIYFANAVAPKDIELTKQQNYKAKITLEDH